MLLLLMCLPCLSRREGKESKVYPLIFGHLSVAPYQRQLTPLLPYPTHRQRITDFSSQKTISCPEDIYESEQQATHPL